MIGALKQMEAGRSAAEVGRELGVSKHTIYAWKAKYGGMSVGEAQRLRQLEDENGRIRKLPVNGFLGARQWRMMPFVNLL